MLFPAAFSAAVAVCDYLYRKIPNRLLLAAILPGFLFRAPGLPDRKSILFSAAAVAALYVSGTLAGGDCKYFLVMALYFPFGRYLRFFVTSFFLALFPAVSVLVKNRGGPGKIPFGVPAGLSAILCLSGFV